MLRKPIIAFFIIMLLTCGNLLAQEIVVSANDQPLNLVLAQLIKENNVSISFNDSGLSNFQVTANSRFKSLEEAISFLISDLPLAYEIRGEVLVIFPKKSEKRQKKWTLSGRVIEQGSAEPLPYSNLMIDNRGTITDMMGNFSVSSETDSIFSIKISHLGYYILDTIVTGSSPMNFELVPSSFGLSEVVIENSRVDRSGQYGQNAGLIKLNHRAAGFLPGYGDNSVFNLLRLQPGILAAGEQTNELIIWGSYEGHSKVVFDGFTIYGLKNFNDNISSFNPLMAKDIEVYKGGWDVKMGERVGGIVNITGKLGNINKTSFEFVANNMTLNALIEVPIAKKGSLILAFRHTYYDLYDPSDLSVLVKRNNDADTTNDANVVIKPDYKFRDINVKYATRLGKHDDLFYVSFYGGIDNFSYHIDEIFRTYQLLKNTKEENSQSGGSVYYGKKWSAMARSHFSFSYSSLRSKFSNDFKLVFPQISKVNQIENKNTDNRLTEVSVKVDNSFNLGSWHTLETGAEIISNRVALVEDTFGVNYLNMQNKSPRINLYGQDVIMLGNQVIVKPGLRLTYANLVRKPYVDPRLSVTYVASKKWRINLAWGKYHQFITRSSVLDEQGNYKYLWTVCDNLEVPVLSAEHYVAGTSFNLSGFTFSMEAYFKNTNGLTRFIRSEAHDIQDIFSGRSQSYGVDVMLKQDVQLHSFWVSYSLSKTEELFTYFLNGKYRRAPQDQCHELKLAGSLNFDPFFFSADYVYGSGFPDFVYSQQTGSESTTYHKTYSRLDVSVVYKFLNRKLKGEAGLSVLNVLNRQNFKLENFERIPAGQTSTINIYAEAIPFTPTLFLKIYL